LSLPAESIQFLRFTKKIELEETIMTTINLRDFYTWYTQDEFVEVPDEVAAAMLEDKKYQKNYERRMRYNKVHSLDAEDGTESAAVVHSTDNPEAIFALMERHCNLCCALNSLPEIQGRRIEAHYFLGMSQQEIADKEGVVKSSVSESITRGLRSMKIFLKNFDEQPELLPCLSPDI